MNPTQSALIAKAITCLRPTWNEAQIRAVIAKCPPSRTPAEVAAALAWVACQPETRQPTRVLEGGPWWGTAEMNIATEVRLPRLPDPTDCDVCGRPKHDADRICDDYAPRNSRTPSTTGAEKARAALNERTKE